MRCFQEGGDQVHPRDRVHEGAGGAVRTRGVRPRARAHRVLREAGEGRKMIWCF